MDVHPLTGQPLESWQRLVTGPVETGYRVTVVDTRPGATLPPWVNRLELPIGDGATVTIFVDTGAAGGTYEGPQQLPELVVTERRTTSLGELVLLAILTFLGGRALRQARGSRAW